MPAIIFKTQITIQTPATEQDTCTQIALQKAISMPRKKNICIKIIHLTAFP